MKRAVPSAVCWFVVLFLVLAGVVVAAKTLPPEQQTQRPRRVMPPPEVEYPGEEVSENDVVRVDTQLITVPVVVRDQHGQPITGLKASDFQLYEDNHQQSLATFATSDAPFEVALLLDTSGSTRAGIALIRSAANAFIESLRPGDRVAVLSFNTIEERRERIAKVAVQSYLTNDREALRGAVQNIGASSGTPYYDALECVAKEIFREPPILEMRGRRALVALTDGVDSASLSNFAPVRAHFLQAGVLTYFVQIDTEGYVGKGLLRECQDDGALRLSSTQLERYRRTFDPRADRAYYADFCLMNPFKRLEISRSLYQLARREMAQLARDTGGRIFEATDLHAARTAFATIAADIGRQYSLGYYSTNKARDGRFRQIRVEVRGLAGAQVSAREGYQPTNVLWENVIERER